MALWTFGDRSDEGMVTSRIGIEAAAEAIEPGASLAPHVADLLEGNIRILVIDEAQFATVPQIDDLARLVDDHGVDVHALWPVGDFLLNVFPASARLFAIADWSHEPSADLVVLVWVKGSMQCSGGEQRRGERRNPIRHR